MTETLQASALSIPRDHPRTLFEALIAARRRHGGATAIVEDATTGTLGYTTLLRAAHALGARIARFTRPGERVGLLLPTSVGGVVAFFALQATGRVPVILNFSEDPENIRTACADAGLEHVLSARRFVDRADLGRTISALEARVGIAHLEDLRESVGVLDKALAGARSALPALAPARAAPEDPAVVLFTSGTIGRPKGVVLSQANVLANIEQCRQHFPLEGWVFFNPMPIFHSLGLTCGTLLPILSGMKAILHPSPLDQKGIPPAVRSSGANVLLCSDTFARLYARAAREGDLAGLDYAVLGGETVSDATRRVFAEKSRAELLEGYGLTETAPVAAANQPGANRPGTVGRLLPGIEARLEDVPGVDAGRRLLVRGPNVMAGYIDPAQGGAVTPRDDAWFDTGDLVRIDADGFVSITGRTKRFVKLGAEMVSLDRVERIAREIWPDHHHAAVRTERGDGEAVTLVSDNPEATRARFVEWAKEKDIARRLIPHDVLVVEAVPLTGLGKPKYGEVGKMVEGRRSAGDAPQANDASGASGSTSST